MPIERLKPAHFFDEERLAALKALAPEAFADGRINWSTLKDALGGELEETEEDAEHFGLNWPGKRESRRLAGKPSTGTLLPAMGEGIDEEKTRNIYIEGENLEVLKLLRKSYTGRVKMIYIDPPYNTGNDFVYDDDFTEPLNDYLKRTGQIDGEGKATTTNKKADGRFHSKWLSMMYPRLRLARELLRDDGVIFVSIDDNEVHHLRMLMNEVFGEENFVANLVWEKGRKNDAKFFSSGHEYILAFAYDISLLREKCILWREEKPGAREIWDMYISLRGKYGNEDKRIEKELSDWYASLDKDNPSKKWARYKHVDQNGPWRDDNISWPGGDGPRYDVIHPITNLPCKVPERGWVYAKSETMQRMIEIGIIEFRADHLDPPLRKSHLRPIAYETVVEEIDEQENDEVEDEADELATQVRGTYFYKQSQVSVKYLRKLMDAKLFNNPKDHEEIGKLIRYANPDSEGIILDFFSGSASTADAVLRANSEYACKYQFILVQMPERCNEKEKTGKAAISKGFDTIAEIGKERIRRVINKVLSEQWEVISKEEKMRYGCKVLSRADCLAKGDGSSSADLFSGEEIAQGRTVRAVGSDAKGRGVDTIQHSRRSGAQLDQRVSPVSGDSDGVEGGAGDPNDSVHESRLPCRYGHFGSDGALTGDREDGECSFKGTKTCPLIANHSPLTTNHSPLDLGFKVYKLARSNFKPWENYHGESVEKIEELFAEYVTPLVPEWRKIENGLLTEILLLEGFPLDSVITPLSAYGENRVVEISSGFHEHRLIVCLDDTIEAATVKALSLRENDSFVCLDSAIDTETKTRLSDKGQIKTI